MKKLYLGALLLGSVLVAGAQSKLDFYGQHIIMEYKNGLLSQESNSEKIKPFSGMNDDSRVSLIVTLGENGSLSDIEAAGGIIVGQRADMAIVSLPMSQVEEFAKIDAVKHVAFPKMARPLLDKARQAASVDWAHNGDGLDKAYIGEGVVVGLMDVGMDPNHVAFRDTANTKTRVKKVWHMNSNDGTSVVYSTPEEIAGFNTDTKSMGHGSHVAGIMTGGYKGNAYYGVAPGADIAMACGTLYNSNILSGVENIVEYAASVGKPAVVNLSVGENIGPHDGKDAFNRYLAELGKEAVICMAAGNEGSYSVVLSKTFTENDTQLKSFIVETYQTGTYMGNIDVWSSNSEPIVAVPVIYDAVADTVVYEMPAFENNTNGAYLCSKDYTLPEGAKMVKDDRFSAVFDGYVGYASGINPNNNRYEVLWVFDIVSVAANKSQYVLAVKIEGKSGTRVDAYSDCYSTEFGTRGKEGWHAPTSDGSVSSMACGENVIVIGSYNSRQYYPRLDGKTYGYPSLPAGPISSFSSYGTLIDGRQLPHLCAPGCFLVSSIGKSYAAYYILNGDYSSYSDYAAKAVEDGRTDYWDVMLGTSMASPFASGAVALLLEANPYLTHKDVLDILTTTADKDSYVTSVSNPVQAGAGKINVYSALVKAIESRAGIDGCLPEEDKRIMLNALGGNRYEIYVAGENELSVVLYNMSGQPVLVNNAEGSTAVVDAANLPAGVYVLAVNGGNTRYTKRIMVK